MNITLKQLMLGHYSLNRLFENTAEAEEFNVAARSLLSTLKGTASGLKDALEWRDRTRVMPVMRELYNWFRFNYESSGGYNLQSRMNGLKQNPKYKDIVQQILSVPSMPNGSESKIGAEGKVLILAGVLSKLVNKMYNNSQLGSELNNAASNVAGLLKQLRSIKWDDIGVDKARDFEVANKKPNVVSQQNQQVEQIINSVLGGLSPDVAGEIRRAIAKSDNKLGALQQEMKKRGLS